MELLNGCFFDGSNHQFGLAVGPWMTWPGLSMLDAILPVDCTKDVAHKAIFSSLVVLDKLHTVVGQHRINFIGNCFDQSFEKTSSHQFRRFTVDSGENNLRCPINRNKQKSFASSYRTSAISMCKYPISYALNRFGFT